MWDKNGAQGMSELRKKNNNIYCVHSPPYADMKNKIYCYCKNERNGKKKNGMTEERNN